ncbi:MAG: hypothetical protein JNL39_20470 [Opitutaceae bacterium]|nr:hypothetical protein [Opitutaceae bacterium]
MFASVPFRLRALALLGLAAAAGAARAQPADRETNRWPVSVRLTGGPDTAESWTGAGPFLFRQPAREPDGGKAHGFRPFWVQIDDAQGRLRSGHLLYPLLNYRTDGTAYQWSLFELVRRWGRHADAPPATSPLEHNEEFEVFPFWFSRTTAEPDRNYRALFPIAGTVKNKLTLERFTWTLFPLYAEIDKRGATTRYLPWPFLRRTEGAARGWGVWPLYATLDRPGVSQLDTWLWPLGYNSVRHPTPDDPPGTPAREDFGMLPFYARSTGPGLKSETYLWPFFGYTLRDGAKAWSETRYLWPLFVQGRGADGRMINRWAPFYSHSISQGVDKRWFLWPLVRHATWDDRDVPRERTQFLYFLWWQESQRLGHRAEAPTARLTHVWPLVSTWDNGAGRGQWQLLSPLEVFFPGNEKVRLAWSPFFALARHEQRAPGDTRTSLLWNAVTWEKRAAEERSEFHLGPLLDITRQGPARRVAIGRGLLGWERRPGGGWRMFAFDFPAKPETSPSATAQ